MGSGFRQSPKSNQTVLSHTPCKKFIKICSWLAEMHCKIEMTMGMGFPMGMGIPWE